MSREIKFRAWDKISKKYFYDSVLENGTEFLIRVDGRIVFEDSSSYKPADIALEQYTGLKDKNGKEIYEGDKFNTDAGTPKTVIFKNGSFGYISKLSNDFMPLDHLITMNKFQYVVIISNIHEVNNA